MTDAEKSVAFSIKILDSGKGLAYEDHTNTNRMTDGCLDEVWPVRFKRLEAGLPASPCMSSGEA